VVRSFLERVHAQGDIYKAEYEGLYSVGQERFVTEKELVDGKLPEDARPPELRKETNYFFRMEKYQSWLIEHIQSHPEFIYPAGFRNEVLGMLREPLGDLSISRPAERVPWGIPIPWDTDHVTYVWFDALVNYISALGYPDGELFARNWPGVWHMIGKDILKQHAVFWPTMLHAAGLPAPERLLVGGYFTGADGRKISKSLGNAIDPFELAEQFGADPIRYYMLRELPYGNDGAFGVAALAERYNADLANDLGNLLSRVRKLILSSLGGVLQEPKQEAADQELIATGTGLLDRLREQVRELRIDSALQEVMQFVRALNRYFDSEQPWRLAKEEAQAQRLATVLYNVAEGLRIVAILLEPALPSKCAAIRDALSLPAATFASTQSWGGIVVGPAVPKKAAHLFPRMEFAAPAPLPATGGSETREPSDTSSDARSDNRTEGLISIDDFARVELRAAEVIAAEPVPKTDRLLQLTLRLGSEERTVVSGIAEHYQPEDLVGRRLVVVANLAPAKLRGIESQGMILAAEDESGKLALVELPGDFASGAVVR
jgi:methionyl-tRNA synthetase